MRIVIRVDVSRQIGTGHLRRMAHLMAAVFRAEPTYLIRTDTPDNVLLASLPSVVTGLGAPEDQMIEECRRARPDVLILDLLRYPAGLVARYRSALAVPVVTFHEHHDWDQHSDLAINYNTFDRFESCAGARMLAGPKYCIIGNGVRSLRRLPRTQTVLATFGGSDPSGFADQFVERVVAAMPETRFQIYEGPLSLSGWFQGNVARMANVERMVSGEAFFSAMATCGIAVTAAGNSMYELVHLGLKPLVVAHNEHQAEFARNADRIGACVFFGRGPDLDWGRLVAEVRRQRSCPTSSLVGIIDGRGAERIAARMDELLR